MAPNRNTSLHTQKIQSRESLSLYPMQTAAKKLIVLAGPTAVGKTTCAIQLAERFQGEILSADSRQFYREMNIGTAKPSPEELTRVPHHFINSLSIFDSYDVGLFERDALQCLQKVYERQQLPLLTGGSGLYIQAVCKGLDDFPVIPKAITQSVEQDLIEKGLQSLQEELRQNDPVYYRQVDLKNPRRLQRALAVIRHTGRPFSAFRQMEHGSKKKKRPFQPLYLLLERPRDELYERINRRVLLMVEQGLLDEARRLFPHRHLKALQTVGYQELFNHLEGKISLDEAVALIQRNSRRYAKRQLTWFRKGDWQRFHPDEHPAIEKMIENFLR